MNKLALIGCLLGAAVVSAQAEIVVVVNAAAQAPTKEQVADVYLGKSKDWVPLDQPEAAAIRAEFYQKATGRDMAQVKSLWARIVFSGKGMAPAEQADAASVKKAVAANPKAVGYIDKAALDGTVKAAFSLN
jgi:ABC-type phosphate transport system substrate-binding protein